MGSGLLTEDHVAREMLQGALVGSLFSGALARRLTVKGGLAMRAGFGTGRLTKDIDLDCDPDTGMDQVRNMVRKAIRESLSEDLVEGAVVTEPKMTETTMRWKIVGRVPGGESALHLTVELSRRRPDASLEVEERVMEGSGGTVARVYRGDAMAWLKANAMLSPNRTAPRDLYDLAVLVEAGVEPPPEMLAGRGVDELERMAAEVWPKIEAMDWALAKTELVPFLTPESAALLTEERWEEMRLLVGTKVEGWVADGLSKARGKLPGGAP